MEAPILHDVAFTSWLKELPSEDVARMADSVRELQQSPAWETLSEALRIGKEKAVGYLTLVGTLGHAEYARTAGYLTGIDQLSRLPEAILKQEERIAQETAERERQAALERS